MGPVIPIPILSGASTVLVNGMPAGRCGDMGLGIWCGGYFPLYEVFLGSSSVWIEGARAARMLVDITTALPVHRAEAAGFSDWTDARHDHQREPNVRIGGVPMPSLMAIAFGAGAARCLQAGREGRASLCPGNGAVASANGQCAAGRQLLSSRKVLRGRAGELHHRRSLGRAAGFFHSGADSVRLDPFLRLAARSRKGSCGYGWSTQADARLVLEDDGVVSFHDGLGAVTLFSPSAGQRLGARDCGRQPARVTSYAFRVRVPNSPEYVSFPREESLPREVLIERLEDGCGNFVRFVRDVEGLCALVDGSRPTYRGDIEGGLVQELQHAGLRAPAALRCWRDTNTARAGELLAAADALGKASCGSSTRTGGSSGTPIATGFPSTTSTTARDSPRDA